MGSLKFWLPWSNPVFLRYWRSQLRPAKFLPSALVVLVGAAFFFFLAWILARRALWPERDAARLALMPLFLLQGVLLMLGGAAGVAVGITREADEGILEYQRLTPMPSLARIAGYLFGLPVRSYLLFLLTAPFTLYAAVVGQVPPGPFAKLYGVFFSSVILYHLTGMVAGSVVRRSWLAALLSVVLVVLLYFLLPFLSRIGYVFFDYLTVRPVVLEQWPHLLPAPIREPAVEFLNSLIPSVPFFGHAVSRTAFTLVVQGSLLFVFLVVVHRKWRQPAHHMLGKAFAVAVFAWLQVLLLGNALPLIADGRIFPSISLGLEHRVPGFAGLRASPVEALALGGLYGLVSLALVLGMVGIVTPDRHQSLQGLRRARKLGLARVPRGSDAAGAFPAMLCLAALGAGSWCVFLWKLFGSEWCPQVRFPAAAWVILPLLFTLLVAAGHAVLEIWERRAVLLAGLGFWVVPCLGAILLGAAASSLVTAGIWLTAVSGAALPFYAVLALAGDEQTVGARFETVRAAFAFSALLHAGAAAWLLRALRREHRRRAESE